MLLEVDMYTTCIDCHKPIPLPTADPFRCPLCRLNAGTRYIEDIQMRYPRMTLADAKQFAALNAEQLFHVKDCPGCDGYVLHASEAPYCPSCARERAAKCSCGCGSAQQHQEF